MPNLDASFSALADPTRRAILARLALGEATVMELAEPFEMTQPAISRHLKVLEGAGLIIRRVEGTKRPCRLAPAAVTEIDQWLAMLRQALSANYDRLDDVLAAMKTERVKGRPDEQDDAEDRRRPPCRRHQALRRRAGSGVSRAHRAGADPEVAARSGRLDDAGLHQRGAAGRQDPLRVDQRRRRRILCNWRISRTGAVQPARSCRADAHARCDAGQPRRNDLRA